MGLYLIGDPDKTKKSSSKSKPVDLSTESLAVLKKRQCGACPLNNADHLRTGKLKANGPRRPEVYLLGEAPGENEDEKGEPFVGKAGKTLRKFAGEEFVESCRVNNTIRCRPPDNRNPTVVEISCCRGFIEEDIELAAPDIVVAIGGVALSWIVGRSLPITKWESRLFPARIGRHVCWVYPVLHPSFVMRQERESRREDQIDWQDHYRYSWNRLHRLLDRGLSKPPYVSVSVSTYDHRPTGKVMAGIDWVEGQESHEIEKVEKWLELLRQKDIVGCDIETQNLRPYSNDSRLLTIALGDNASTFAFPVDHPAAWRGRGNRKLVVDMVGEFLADPEGPVKVLQNAMFEKEWFTHYYGKIAVYGSFWEDTMTCAYVMDTRTRMHNLDTLVFLEYGFWLKALSPDMNMSNMVAEPLHKVLPYNGLDAKWTYKIWPRLWKRLCQMDEGRDPEESGLRWIYRYMMEQASGTLAFAQHLGMEVDEKERSKQSRKLAKDLEQCLGEIAENPAALRFRKRFGKEFDPASNKDVPTMFTEVLGRDEVITRDGKVNTKEAVLAAMPSKVTIAPLILRYRRITKLQTYVDGYLEFIHDDGRIHTIYNQIVVITGRLSSEQPNSQNMPRRRDGWVRKIIVARKGYVIVAIDLGQIDARNIAFASEDRNYVDALWEGMDVHQFWTDRIVDSYPRILDNYYEKAKDHGIKDPEDEGQLVAAIRDRVKNKWTFPAFYGSELEPIARALDVPISVLSPLFGDFWDFFSGVRDWQKWMIKFYNEHHYIETLQGRRIYGPLTENQVYNTAIQGTTAEVMLDGMNRCVDEAIDADRNRVNRSLLPFLQIHDDAAFGMKNDDRLKSRIRRTARIICEPVFPWVIAPLVAEVKVGPSLGEMTPYKVFSSTDFGHRR